MVRYVGEDDTGENITKDEVDRLHAAGLKIALVYQTGKQFMLEGGFERGRLAASVALWQGVSVGMPPDRPVYFALDVDPTSIQHEGWTVVESFLAGAASVIGLDRVGVYGGRLAIDSLVPWHATWGWQTYAWSGYRKDADPDVWADSREQDIWSAKANVIQYRNGQTLCDGLVDFNKSITADFGQW